MSKTIALSNRAWGRLKEKIVEDYGRTTILISWRLRDRLGFTVREHYDYNADYDDRKPIRLDFWCDQMQTMFLLKYSDYLTTEHNPNVY
jgi:hypothetical protein